MHFKDQIKLADVFLAHLGRGSDATISNKAVGHARHFKRLRHGKGCTLRNALRVVDWFDKNWPEDLAWPEGIDRPSSKSKDAA
ncbi:MAG: hypothetical protein AAGI09_02735 [Pseudomonadota bacterium]